MASMFQPGAGAIPATLVEISVSCRNLHDMDVFSKSDPLCVLYVKDRGSERYRELGRTEVIWNNLNPDFVKKFTMHYFFEERQMLRFEVFDVDSKSADLSKHDFLGRMECSLGEVVSAGRLQKPLTGQNIKKGAIIVTADEMTSCKEEATMQFFGRKLDKKDFFGKSDPFLVFYRSNEDGSFTVVHKTEVIKNTLNPNWNVFTIPVRSLCNGDYDRSIKVECYDWDRDGGHDLIGEFFTTLRELSKGKCGQNEFECINPKKKAKKGAKYKNSGVITVESCRVVQVPTFLDYIKGGTQLQCTIAIDFTASNGDPRTPTSLHYINPYQPTQYAMALQAVGEIIEDYDSDKLFPVLGFGARLPPDGRISHEFFVNMHPTDPYCAGLQGVMQAYSNALQKVQLYGPTNFAPVINHVARFASARRNGTDYFILLILTDGIITDMPQTKEAIVNAASLPMSIIIVGIGEADFDAMVELDGDDIRVSSRGRYAERDIVQFVPFRDFIRSNSDMGISKAQLAKEVLEEIPDQFISYMKKHNIKPQPPQAVQSLPPAL
ncbi:copine-8 isoform X2 [Lingula anatina]|uniref:Copine-8 isoform X2 n=1 Tax=Lingula anatina TaxID=7574 RepID=A0A1S3JG44_LINAN|nr:copine-8 isoform X2 [Lingula anatina]|eukprot:XP_013408869.1 copine-8 isoform X2 [Lingula anatina]